MKKVKIEDMKVIISYSENMVDKDHFYGILTNIIKRLEIENKEVEKDEKKCNTFTC